MIRRTARIFVFLGPSKSVLCADLARTLFRYSNCVRLFFIQPHGCAHSPPRLEPWRARGTGANSRFEPVTKFDRPLRRRGSFSAYWPWFSYNQKHNEDNLDERAL